MSGDIILYTNPYSRGRTVRWMLEEIGIPYRVEVLDYATTMKSPEYLAINPMGKVPALRHGDAIVTEAAAICTYLADAFPDAKLAPAPGTPERAAYFRWLFFGAGPLEAAGVNQALGVEVKPEQERIAGYGSLARVTGALDQALSHSPYLTGDTFTAADLYVGASLGWLIGFKIIPSTPTLAAYVGKLRQRPAAIKAAALDDALVPAKA